MRRWMLLLVMVGISLSNTGCLINIYSSDPNRRMKELLVVSENLRVMQDEWERIWFTDTPSNLTPTRVSGATGP
ncbi:MAG: hypothetical protein ACK4RK_08485 [Gemmataceae bacterium]